MATALVWVIAAGAGLGKFTWGQIMSGNTKRLGDRAIQALRPGQDCFEECYWQRVLHNLAQKAMGMNIVPSDNTAEKHHKNQSAILRFLRGIAATSQNLFEFFNRERRIAPVQHCVTIRADRAHLGYRIYFVFSCDG